ELQPACRVQCAGKRGGGDELRKCRPEAPAAPARRRAALPAGAGRAPCPQAPAPLARRAAAGRHRPRLGQQSADHPRRRTLRQPRCCDGRRGDGRPSGRLPPGWKDIATGLARGGRTRRRRPSHRHGHAQSRRDRQGHDRQPMTILAIALKYLRGRLLASALTAVSIALGVGLAIASILIASAIKEGFVAGATDYNLVIGAKGSPTQLVLAVVFRMDVATPNIEYTIYKELKEDPRVDV